MLRSQVKRQGSSYVCASCRQQHPRNLAQLRSECRIRTTALVSSTRSVSSTALATSKLPVTRVSQHAASRSHRDGPCLQPRAGRVDARMYASWGRFGSGMVPGQSNAAWGPSHLKTSGAPGVYSSPTPGFGGAAGSNIPSAAGTAARGGNIPSAAGTAARGGNIPSAAGTAAPGGKPDTVGGIPSVGRASLAGGVSSANSKPEAPASAVSEGAFSSQTQTRVSATPSPASSSSDLSRSIPGARPRTSSRSGLERQSFPSGQPTLSQTSPQAFANKPSTPSRQPTSIPGSASHRGAFPNRETAGKQVFKADAGIFQQRPAFESSTRPVEKAPTRQRPPSMQAGKDFIFRNGVKVPIEEAERGLHRDSKWVGSSDPYNKNTVTGQSRPREHNPQSSTAPARDPSLPPRMQPLQSREPRSKDSAVNSSEPQTSRPSLSSTVAHQSTWGSSNEGATRDKAVPPRWDTSTPAWGPGNSFGRMNNSWATNTPNSSKPSGGIPPAKPTYGASTIPQATPTIRPDIFEDFRPGENMRAPGLQSTTPKSSASTTPAGRATDLSGYTGYERPFPSSQVSGYPQFRRKESKDSAFETMSPFTLPDKESRERQRRLYFESGHDRYPDGDSGSSIGQVAPPDNLEVNPRPERRIEAPWTQRRPGAGAFGQSQGSFPQMPEGQSLGITNLEEQFETKMKTGSSEENERRQKKKVNDDNWGFTDEEIAATKAAPSANVRDRDQAVSSLDDYGGITIDLNQNSDNREQGVSRTDDRRGRRRDFDPDVDRPDRGKERSKKRSNNRRQAYHDNEEEADVDYEEAMEMRAERRRLMEEKAAREAAKAAAAPKTILLPEFIAVYDLAEALHVKPKQFVLDLEQLGFENILHDSVMTGETAALVAAEYGFEATVETGEGVDLRPRPPPEDPSSVPPRPPIVTIMGHVDHGKTTLLDWLRKSSIVAQEHGGITQHIGAFSVRLSAGKTITFLDTPGHAAFLNMRQRGANVTDIVVLVVAVDDSVMPQTIEALKHAQNAKVPIIVAINKIDVDENRIDTVKQDLASNGVEIEDYGGDVQVVAISAKTGRGMKDLEESILTLSEILDVRAETDGLAEGWILESSVKPDGKVSNILVTRGTLRVRDLIVAGTTYARVRVMRNEAGVELEEAGPGTPVEVYAGWEEVPVAGDMVLEAPDENKARTAVEYRKELEERTAAAAQKSGEEQANREKAEKEALEKMMEEAGEEVEAEEVETGPKTINFIIRGDVAGSVEAVTASVQEIGSNEVRPRILRSAPGQLSESDIDLLSMAKGHAINFNNTIPPHIQSLADSHGVKILDHNIIYHLVDDVKSIMSQHLKPIYSQRVLAEAEVLQVFPINIVKRKYKNIAGVKVRNGTVVRGGLYRVMRNGENIHQGKLDALKQGKKDVNDVKNGVECGMSFDEYDDFQPGDVIQMYKEVEEKRYL